MSFHINSDKEKLRGVNPKLIGDENVTIRVGTGSDENEILRLQKDAQSGLPRVGINRTGQRVNSITVTAGGSGYTSNPTIEIAPPPSGGRRALASGFIFNGQLSTISVTDPGDGYTTPPLVTISGGNGVGAAAESVLDIIEFELDINGAIRTSTSIISDTARVLNLDIDNFVTPDLNLRGPNFKTYVNGTGEEWNNNDVYNKNDFVFFGQNVYQALNDGRSGSSAPTHKDGIVLDGNPLGQLNQGIEWKHVGFRVVDPNAPYYLETGEAGLYPRSITPLLGDRSDKIATTEYVLNLATNDVGGRIYVSSQIGSNLNDGRSAVAPVQTIKRAAQIAWSTPGIKETIVVSGGDYIEDNPISLPPDCSVVGDNLRLVIIRPQNAGKDIFKFGDKNYVTGVTYRDQQDSFGESTITWGYAMVFDDKQRVIIDNEVNGDFGVDFEIGHQIVGPSRFRLVFSGNTGGASLVSGLDAVAQLGARVRIISVKFDDLTGPDAFISGTVDLEIISGGFTSSEEFTYFTNATQGAQIAGLTASAGAGTNSLRFTMDPTTSIPAGSYVYLDDVNNSFFTAGFYEVTGIIDDFAPAYWDVQFASVLNAPGWSTTDSFNVDVYQATTTSALFDSESSESIRAEGEVVAIDEDIISDLPIDRIDFSLQGDPSIATGGFQSDQFGNAEDLGGIVIYTNELKGRDNIHDFKEGQEIIITGMPDNNPDLTSLNGKQRIYKVIEDADGRSRRFVIPKKFPNLSLQDFEPGQEARVKSYSKSITLSLRNSPNKFPLSTPVDRRYQDACQLIRNNREFIADEVVGRINREFAKDYYSVYNISGNSFDIYLGTSTYEHTYVSGGTVEFGGTTVNITDFQWDNIVTGVATITTDALSGAAEDDTVKLANILVSCSNGQKLYPSFSIPVDDEQCRQDIVHFLNALVRDLEFGSNHNIIEAAEKYIVGAKVAYVENEIIQTVRAIEYARQLAIYAMCNWRTGNRTTSDPIYTPVYSSLARYFDDTVITATAGTPACDDVRSAIDTLSYLWVDVIANDASGTYLDAAYLIARNRDLIADQAYLDTLVQYPSLGLNNVDERKCRRDINYIISGLIRDLVLGGNTGIVTAAESYFTGTALSGIPASELGATRYAFGLVGTYSIAAMRNWSNGAGTPITTSSPIPQFTDGTILADPGSPDCANVASSIITSIDTLDSILEYADNPASPTAAAPGSIAKTTGTLFNTAAVVTYPDSYIYDTFGTRMAIRGDYDDYPIIEASPYTQNASIISFKGGSGALVDGSKVKQPNCPRPGLNDDATPTSPATASTPNQGKSMVAAAFTIVSFGGTGYKIVNDGYVQLVSVFVIFCKDGILAETGGYASVTNSATNFGTFALRANGFRAEPYSFDIATIQSISQTAAGRTTMVLTGLGRPPIEHYVIKIDGYSTEASNIEYFIDDVGSVSAAAPYTATITVASGDGNDPLELVRDSDGTLITGLAALQQEFTPQGSANATLNLHRPSIVNSSSHTWEFAGSGTNYLALPENGGTKREEYEQVDGPTENYGRVYVSGTDELGDFKVGTFAKIENRTGAITFTGTVTISEVEFLKLKGGTVVVTGFSADNTLGGSSATDSKLPTQKAVRDFITNNLGAYINKPYSTNAVPRALVELTDSGKISVDQIPALRPFEVYTVADQAARTSIEGALAGDIAIQQDTAQSFILNNDNDSLFLAFAVDPTLTFTDNGSGPSVGQVYTGTPSGGRIQSTEYREGVVYQITLTNGGSGYTTPPVVTISGGNPVTGFTPATANCTIANGEVITINITNAGEGYTTPPLVTIAAPPGAGIQATANSLIESRIYGNIINNIKIADTDTFDDDTGTAINITRAINTSSFNANNWVSLSSNQIAATDITSGVIEPDRLASGGAASSFTFLRGDQNYAPVVQTIKGVERRYFAPLYSQAPSGSNQLVFQKADILDNLVIGHEVSNSVTGIDDDTNITGFTDDPNSTLTTVAIDNPITSGVTIPAGTFIEFFRSKSPIKIDSNQTKGDFVAEILIANPGTGYTQGTYNNVPLTGNTTGTGLEANIVVDSNGSITNVTITDGGSGYTPYKDANDNGDFSITIPVEIGAGNSAVLLAKITTTTRSFGFLGLDVERVTDATISSDPFGTGGVAKFKKSQFVIGSDGSVTLKDQTNTASSGLDADLLDGLQGIDYLDGQYFIDRSITPLKLQQGVEYSINIDGYSTESSRLLTNTQNSNSNPAPFEAVSGLVLRTIFDSADGLSTQYPQVVSGNASAQKHLVMTIRTAGESSTVDGGGVRQLAFANDDNMYLRGSGDVLNQFSNWGKVWTSNNDGPGNTISGRGPDADLLDNKQGTWYQNAWNINENDPKTQEPAKFWETYLPRFISSTKVRDKLEIKSFAGTDTSYSIFFRQVLDITPTGLFRASNVVNLYDIGKNNIGNFTIDAPVQHVDANDSTNSYTILQGRLSSGGSFATAYYVGVAGSEVEFDAYAILDSNTYQVGEFGNDGGDGYLRLGRKDGQTSTPYVYFNSSSVAANYDVALVASGGTAVGQSPIDGQGALNIIVADENQLTVRSNIIWNAGNVAFNSTNVASTTSLKSAVVRDTSGNFAAGTITASLTGAASLNVLKTGDTMTGALTISGVTEGTVALSVSGETNLLAGATIEDNLEVDGGTLFVDSANNRVTVGAYIVDGNRFDPNPLRFNVVLAAGSLEFQSNTSLTQVGIYQSSIYNKVDGGESGLLLQHGNLTPTQWGISAKRTDSYVGDLVFRTRTGTSSGAERLRISATGNVAPGATKAQHLGTESKMWSAVYSEYAEIFTSIRISDASGNNGADLQFKGASSGAGGGRSWRMGNALNSGADVFEISASSSLGGTDWRTALTTPEAPVLAFNGQTNAVAINTTLFSGTDTTVTPNQQRNYILNVEGDVNINGQLFQDNAEFVTSRWTESSDNDGANIYRESFVGINKTDPQFALDVDGDSQVFGNFDIKNEVVENVTTIKSLKANGDEQWIDTYGIIKTNRNNIAEDITIPQDTNAVSAGPITINNGSTVTISEGAFWSIV